VDNLLVKAMCAEACSVFLVSDCYNKSVNNICDGINESDDIYVYVISILVICLDCPA
jgi:hypothetical protein